jgi:hypothetical protein
MSQISLPITSRSDTDDNLFSDVYGNDLAITNVINGGLDEGNFTGGTLPVSGIANGAITDAKLASPNNSTYKLLLTASGIISNNETSGQVDLFRANGGALIGSGDDVLYSSTSSAPPIWTSSPLLQLVANRTQVIRVVVSYASNSTAIGTNITFGLYPLSAVSTSGEDIQLTAGTVVTGSTCQITPAVNTFTSGASAADVNYPAAGQYALGAVTFADVTANHVGYVTVQLLTRNV